MSDKDNASKPVAGSGVVPVSMMGLPTFHAEVGSLPYDGPLADLELLRADETDGRAGRLSIRTATHVEQLNTFSEVDRERLAVILEAGVRNPEACRISTEKVTFSDSSSCAGYIWLAVWHETWLVPSTEIPAQAPGKKEAFDPFSTPIGERREEPASPPPAPVQE